MDRNPSTVEEVRHAQDLFREGYNFHEKKQYKEANNLRVGFDNRTRCEWNQDK